MQVSAAMADRERRSRFTVLGAGGFIGKRLVDHLQRKGHEVSAVSRSDSLEYGRAGGHVIFCIGLTEDYWKRPLDTAEAHVCALIPVLRRGSFESLVYLSSTRLYDGLKGTLDETSDLRVNPQNPRHVYDLSKAVGEALVHQAGLAGKVARLANVYDDRLDREDFLCRTIQRALRTNAFEVDAAPEGGRDYVHIEDVCTAVEAIALKGRHSTYNVATGKIFTNQQLAELCERLLKCRMTFAGALANRPPKINVRRLHDELGLHPLDASCRLPGILAALAAERIGESTGSH